MMGRNNNMKKIILATIILIFVLCLFTGCGSGSSDDSDGFINSAQLADDGTIDVVWDKVENAEEYEIYRASEEDGEYALIGTAAGDVTFLTDADVQLHETYWYKVKSVSDGNASDFSNAVAAYVSDKPISNAHMTFTIGWVGEDAENNDPFDCQAGEGFGTDVYDVKITPCLNGAPISDCDVYYDKSSMEMEQISSDTYQVKILKGGKHIITFSSGGETGTLDYAAEKHPSFDNDFFQLDCEQFGGMFGLNDICYPVTRDSTLNMEHNGIPASDLKANSSNPSIAEVAVEDGTIYVTNNAPGECIINIEGMGNKGEVTWEVRRGAALDDSGIQSAKTGAQSRKAGFNTNSALFEENGTVDVVWKKVDNADQFEIYRATKEDGEYSLIGTAKGNKTFFNDKDVKLHETYWYKVRYDAAGEMSEFSDVVSAYVRDDPILNEKMTCQEIYPEGPAAECSAGEGFMSMDFAIEQIVPLLNGKPISDCTVYYDKSALELEKTDSGAFNVNAKKYGNTTITVISGKEKATFGFAISKWPEFDNEYFQVMWHPSKDEIVVNEIFYPETKENLLHIRHDGKAVSGIEAKSSNPDIAEVSVSKDKVIVKNKSLGECIITVSSGENKSEITWIVQRGGALQQHAVYGIPVNKNIDRAKAKKAIKTILAADYSAKEMKKLANEDLTLEEWQKKLSKPSDVITMLRALKFNDANDDSKKVDNDDVQSNGRMWLRKGSPEFNFKQRFLVCLSTCEMMNYLLRNDMEEQGYVEYADPGGGHTLCYYKVNGLYVFCDFVDSIALGDWPNDNHVVYVCDDLEAFADFYVSGPEQKDPKKAGYIDVLYMFPMEGRAISSAADDSAYHLPNTSVMSVLPEKWNGKDIKDLVTILYRAPGFKEQYAPGPDESLFPEK